MDCLLDREIAALTRWSLPSCSRPSIGIGGSRGSSPPTPPYVRVRIRRFGGLSIHVRHGWQTQTTEASFGEGPVQSFAEADPPRTLGVDLHSNLRLGPMWVKSGTENETGASFSLDLGAKFLERCQAKAA